MSGSPTPPSAAPVAVVMGSSSDLETMRGAIDVLDRLHVESQTRVVSAHRTPHDMVAFAEQAAGRGVRVIIAGAGGAAHLPGMLAAVTHLPVIGVPVPLKYLDGMDALLSMAQMPAGVPVATVGVGNSRNAALLAARILALADDGLAERLVARMGEATEMARNQDRDLRNSEAVPADADKTADKTTDETA